ncbi:hypothetical protein HX794_23615 [Pseudomonas costantinii]|uniref:hypothetical protein n=1 Tax=Pseudomonas costantinii TaxID=168469 RepID=UPI0015A23240|nr:hypothetical protein [Pseudomonas costantinii]NVZ22637.1 hypothetical protein [Pseudomonas costantinii]
MSDARRYVFYSGDLIKGHGSMSSAEAKVTAVLNGHEGALELPDGIELDQVYIERGRLRERMKMPIAVDGLTITGIPKGATLAAHGTSVIVDDGTAVLSFDEPGTHAVTIALPPQWLDYSLEVVA